MGYSIRFEEVVSDWTKIKFMTDGILIREVIGDPWLEQERPPLARRMTS